MNYLGLCAEGKIKGLGGWDYSLTKMPWGGGGGAGVVGDLKTNLF